MMQPPKILQVIPTLETGGAERTAVDIGNAITAHGGKMDAAADALGIARRTLNEKIVKLGLDKDTLL